MTNFQPFQYSLRSYDIDEINDDTKEILDIKDNQLQNYLNFDLKEQLVFLESSTFMRLGTGVITLPAVGSFVSVAYNSAVFTGGGNVINNPTPFSSDIAWGGIIVTVDNGDPAANGAVLGVLSEGLSSFRVYHLSSGAVGNACRFNVQSIAFV